MGKEVLDELLTFCHLESFSYASQIDASAITADFPAYTAGAKLIWYRRVGLECEFDGAAMAAAF
jgi:hypothetical protein